MLVIYNQSLDFFDLQEHMTAVLGFTDLLTIFPKPSFQGMLGLRSDLMDKRLDDIVTKLVLGKGDETR